MKAYHWFIIGILLLAADLAHAFMTSFMLIHYLIIGLSTFFIIAAFIITGGKDDGSKFPLNLESGDLLTKSEKNKSSSKILIYVIVVVIASLLYFFFKQQAIGFAKSNAWIWSIVEHIQFQIDGRTLLGLFYAAFFGALFFTPIPLELIFIYYLTLDYNVFLLLGIMLIGGILGEIINYLFGLTLGSTLFRAIFKETYDKWKTRSEKYGGFLLFFASALPLPLGILALIMGSMRYNLLKFIAYVGFGRLVRYSAIIWLQVYFVKYLLPFFSSLFS